MLRPIPEEEGKSWKFDGSKWQAGYLRIFFFKKILTVRAQNFK